MAKSAKKPGIVRRTAGAVGRAAKAVYRGVKKAAPHVVKAAAIAGAAYGAHKVARSATRSKAMPHDPYKGRSPQVARVSKGPALGRRKSTTPKLGHTSKLKARARGADNRLKYTKTK